MGIEEYKLKSFYFSLFRHLQDSQMTLVGSLTVVTLVFLLFGLGRINNREVN